MPLALGVLRFEELGIFGFGCFAIWVWVTGFRFFFFKFIRKTGPGSGFLVLNLDRARKCPGFKF